jgi:hypothetical protein
MVEVFPRFMPTSTLGRLKMKIPSWACRSLLLAFALPIAGCGSDKITTEILDGGPEPADTGVSEAGWNHELECASECPRYVAALEECEDPSRNRIAASCEQNCNDFFDFAATIGCEDAYGAVVQLWGFPGSYTCSEEGLQPTAAFDEVWSRATDCFTGTEPFDDDVCSDQLDTLRIRGDLRGEEVDLSIWSSFMMFTRFVPGGYAGVDFVFSEIEDIEAPQSISSGVLSSRSSLRFDQGLAVPASVVMRRASSVLPGAEIICSGESTRIDSVVYDELTEYGFGSGIERVRTKLRNLGTFGTCPGGEPVEGEVDICTSVRGRNGGADCGVGKDDRGFWYSSASSSLTGATFELDGDLFGAAMARGDGATLLFRGPMGFALFSLDGESEATSGTFNVLDGILQMPAESSDPEAFYCVNSGTVTETRAPSSDPLFRFALSGFRRLGTCAEASPIDGKLDTCFVFAH